MLVTWWNMIGVGGIGEDKYDSFTGTSRMKSTKVQTLGAVACMRGSRATRTR